MKFRVQKFAFALVTSLAFLIGCSDGAGSKRPSSSSTVVLGFSPVVSVGNWAGANSDSIRKSAREAGIELRLEDADHSQEAQVASLRNFIRQRVDVIAFSPVVETGYEAVLREVRAARIPVILVDRNIDVSDDSLYVSLVGSDFVEEGRRAARWLVENTRDLPGDIDIVELQGTVGSAPANDRKQGFAEIIAADRRYRIVRSQSANFELVRARKIMGEWLAAEGHHIRVLFSHNDSMAIGGIEAIEAAGLRPGTDVLVIAIEGSSRGLEAIVAGKLNVAVECNPLLGPQLMSVVGDVAAGKPVPRRVVTKETVFTRENAPAELPNRAY